MGVSEQVHVSKMGAGKLHLCSRGEWNIPGGAVTALWPPFFQRFTITPGATEQELVPWGYSSLCLASSSPTCLQNVGSSSSLFAKFYLWLRWRGASSLILWGGQNWKRRCKPRTSKGEEVGGVAERKVSLPKLWKHHLGKRGENSLYFKTRWQLCSDFLVILWQHRQWLWTCCWVWGLCWGGGS